MIESIRELFQFSKTKCLGYLIFAAGTIHGLRPGGDTNVMMQSWYLSAILVGGKTITNAIKEVKGVNKNV